MYHHYWLQYNFDELRYITIYMILMNSDITMMNAPTEVIVNTFVRSIDKIDDYKMEWVIKASY